MNGSASDAGLSNWWPTPVRPSDHFSADELARSADLLGPIRRIRRDLALTRVGLLVVTALALGADPVADGLVPAGSTLRALVGAAAVLLSIRGAELVAARRLSRLDGVEPVEVTTALGGGLGTGSRGWRSARAVSAVGGTTVAFVALALAARQLSGPLTDQFTGKVLAVVIAAVVTGATLVATGVRAARAPEVEAAPRWVELIARSGLAGPNGTGVEFRLLVEGSSNGSDPGSASDSAGDGGLGWPNACAIAVGRRRWILVDPSLLGPVPTGPPASEEANRYRSGAPAPIGDFVVAHEVTHLARGHPELQAVLYASVVLAAAVAVPLAAPYEQPWGLFGLAPNDPLALPVTVLVVLGVAAVARLPVAWILRGFERVADAGAVELVGVPDRRAVTNLHLGAGGELDPPWSARVLAVRPTPSERLEYLSRCRRSVRPPPPPDPDRRSTP